MNRLTFNDDALSWLLTLAPDATDALEDLLPDVDDRRQVSEALRRLALVDQYPRLLRKAVLEAVHRTAKAVDEFNGAWIRFNVREGLVDFARGDYFVSLGMRLGQLTIGTRVLTPNEVERARAIERALKGTGLDVSLFAVDKKLERESRRKP